MKNIFVYGSGGHGKVVADILLANGIKLSGFIDDNPKNHNSKVLGFPVVGGNDWFINESTKTNLTIALGIGNNQIRKLVAEKCVSLGIELMTLIHPKAILSPFAKVGLGTVVMAGAIINPDAQIGLGAIINSGSIVEHDCFVGDYAHISPNASMGGAASLGNLSHLGLGAVILPLIKVGSSSIIGAGAVVVKDIEDCSVAIGVPAKTHRKIE